MGTPEGKILATDIVSQNWLRINKKIVIFDVYLKKI